ncbi:hypothetical protein DICVIV_01173 [Dictyocaulus viviparus]|uniref:BAR domain-containing protein n=1 Tax=Dictyocaulus viviparus TaxID=29172 RepID=A0A0D8Y6U0_DICVI|nr:hypothetical protein DICVIV_01173 [Dictyocaulus viviparus]
MALIETCEAIMQIMQGNPDHLPSVNSTQQLEYPPNTAPSEVFAKSLHNVKPFWYDEELVSQCKTQCAMIAAKQREFQNRGRRQIHLIRTFINNVYFEFEDLKKALMKSKDELEFAQEELKSGETILRKRAVKKATERYENKLKALDSFLSERFTELKNQHVKEIQMIINEAQCYHDWMASYCRPLANYKVHRPPNL